MERWTTIRSCRAAILALGVVAVALPPGDAAAEPAAPLPGAAATAPAAEPGATSGPQSILDMDIEQLGKVDVKVPSMDVEVTSVSKQESTVGRSPAAVFVITQEMIRRSGSTSVPELLRMAPGVEVARINSHAWAITARGFNARFSNKLLVLIDGREVYNQLYSGVYWDAQDLLLEDIERIEVIRGPGGTLWGANAVNGVINIITKRSQDTQGALVATGGGNLDTSTSGVRVGGSDGQGLSWRVYGKHFERGCEYSPIGAHDDWRMGRGGFRMDWEPDRSRSNTLTVQGDYYGGQEGQSLRTPLPYDPYSRLIVEDEAASGANVLARFTHVIDEESDWSLQAYADQAYRNQFIARQQLNTLDFEFQHRFPLGERHRFIWGLRYRQIHDYLPIETFQARFLPAERTTGLFSGFVQDEIPLVEEELFFTVGSKLENNSFTGFEYQPSARLLWTSDRKHAAWAAISRAVRTPSRFEEDAVANLGPVRSHLPPMVGFFRLNGSRDVRSEDVVAYEIGYREQTTERFAWDVAVFYNVYDNLIWSYPTGWRIEDTYVVYLSQERNFVQATAYGAELSSQWTLSDRWRLSGSYSYLRLAAESYPGDTEEFSAYAGNSPLNQFRFYSSWDLGAFWEFDLGLRYVDNLPAENVPAYLAMDVRLGWKPRKNLEVAIVGQNLLDSHHPEFGPEAYGFAAAEVRRTILAQMTWRR